MKFKQAEFWLPNDETLVTALTSGLLRNYRTVKVERVSCPDLKEFGLASRGLGGSTALYEFGGEPYAHNPRYRGAKVNINEMLLAAGAKGAKVLGAAMADAESINNNSGEMISNRDSSGDNLSRVARVGSEGQCIVEPYSSSDCGPIANLFVSEGRQSDVLRIEVRQRIGAQLSLTQSIRESLKAVCSNGREIGIGGAFQLKKGRVKSHVMPNYDCLVEGYYDTEQEMVVKDFLQFYEHMGPDLLCLCTLWTGDPSGGDLNLRTSGEHTHFYHLNDDRQQAGHYHGDVTPDEVHYVGYFALAEKIVRFGDIYEELGIKP
jgi:hypothetical protein